jgi:OmcA/MtrC family decaheme c-type cytochrome
MMPSYLNSKSLRWIAAIFLVACALGSNVARKYTFSKHDKAFYATQATVDFVRPGLVVKVTGAQVKADGTLSATVAISDPQGLPLDKDGITTPGAVALSCTMAVLPKNSNDFVSYTSFPATAKNGAKATQVWYDFGTNWAKAGEGQYTFTFSSKAPAGFDITATHRVGCGGNRDLTAFSNLGVYHSYSTLDFTPGSATPPAHVHDIVRTDGCNKCHDSLAFHGGEVGSVEMCVLCHTAAAADPTTGNSLYFPVMIHKIHTGSSLPSVQAKKPYQIVGYAGHVSDFSTVVYHADVRRCTTCHDPKSGAAQASNNVTNPTAKACGACHDNVNFTTGVNHAGGPQPDNNQCANCHQPQGETEFDASIQGAHTVPIDSKMLDGVAVEILNVTGSAGESPTVTFTVKNGKGVPIPLNQLQSDPNVMGVVLAGPTTDYGYTDFGVGPVGYVSEDPTMGKCAANGTCTYTFAAKIPKNATGTFAVGIEATRLGTLLAGTTKQQDVEYGAPNKIFYFSVDGSPVQPRRMVALTDNCNNCHVHIAAHGQPRNNVEMCILCHNPSLNDAATRAQSKDPTDLATLPQALNFNFMIHRIHTGENLAAMKSSYLIISHRGRHMDFSDVRYPAMDTSGSTGYTANCDKCHTNSSDENLPIGLNNISDPQGYINPAPAVYAACSGCHANKSMASHAMTNTNSLGESCDTCHGAQAQFSVGKMHAQ